MIARWRALVAVAILVTACSRPAPSPTPVPAPSGSASPAVASAVPAPWGPLAVIPPQDGADTARTEGTLRISDACVALESPGGMTILVWPADRTRWSAEAAAITFANFDGSVVTVRDGDAVVLGGSGDNEDESGESGEEWVAGIAWVAPPATTCALDQRWFVGALERPGAP